MDQFVKPQEVTKDVGSSDESIKEIPDDSMNGKNTTDSTSTFHNIVITIFYIVFIVNYTIVHKTKKDINLKIF